MGKGPARKGYDFSSQVPVITRAVNRTLQDICQVEATLTSSEYKGQNIGNGFYFYQYYDMDKVIESALRRARQYGLYEG